MGISQTKQINMKTAMQEALDNLSSLKVNTESEMELMGRVAAILLMQIEKEKEQIIDAFEQGIEFSFPTNGSYYYNQTYN